MNAAVLFADLAGFTALTEAHGDQDAADLATRFYAIARASLGGEARLVKTLGDAVMIAGPHVGEVVAVALHVLDAVDAEPDFPALRAGIAEGPVVERERDLFGATVNLAARVTAHARAGQVLGEPAPVGRTPPMRGCPRWRNGSDDSSPPRSRRTRCGS